MLFDWSLLSAVSVRLRFCPEMRRAEVVTFSPWQPLQRCPVFPQCKQRFSLRRFSISVGAMPFSFSSW
jgi:hypothetical protein